MFTRDDFPRGPRAARNAGLVHHLLKPIKRSGLLDAVASVMARDQTAAGRPAAPRPLRVENSPAFRILLAEDSEDNRLLMAAFLRNSPCQLDNAENAAMREGEREQGASPTPLVALTGKAMAEDRVRSIEVGCNGHLTKPLQREALMEAISRFSSAAPAN